MLLPALARRIENRVRLPASQPLIPKMHRQTRQQPQFLGKSPRLAGLRTRLAREMHRIAHHNPRAPKPPAKSSQRAQILAWIPLPRQSQHRLREQPQLIRNSHTNSLRPNVETEVTGYGSSFQRDAPSVAGGGPSFQLKASQFTSTGIPKLQSKDWNRRQGIGIQSYS